MTEDTTDVELELVRAVLAGEPGASDRLHEYLESVVQARIARMLLYAGFSGARVRQDIADYTHEAFAMLLAERARAVQGWDPVRGLSLKNYVGQRIQWFMLSRLRALGVTVPCIDADDFPGERPVFEERDQLQRLELEIERKWSSFGRRLFQLLFVLEASSKQVSDETGLAQNSVDQWRCRMRAFSREFLLKE